MWLTQNSTLFTLCRLERVGGNLERARRRVPVQRGQGDACPEGRCTERGLGLWGKCRDQALDLRRILGPSPASCFSTGLYTGGENVEIKLRAAAKHVMAVPRPEPTDDASVDPVLEGNTPSLAIRK